MKQYYEAYEQRYQTIHARGESWASDTRTPIVLDVLERYRISREAPILEIGCGEGRDAKAVLEKGYALTATDLSEEAIDYCKNKFPAYAGHFAQFDCINGSLSEKFRFLYAVAVIHMLVLDKDRDAFYRFFREHLTEDGLGLICSMGDGEQEMQSDIAQAFTLQERQHPSGKILVAATSCRMVSFSSFEEEIRRNGLEIVEKGLTEAMPDFNSLLYAIVRK